MHALLGQVLDVGGDGVEDGGGGCRRGQTEGEAQLPIKIAPAEGGVVAVGQAEACLRGAVTQGPQHARLADAGLADEEDLFAVGERLDERVDDGLLGRRQPQGIVGDFLGERCVAQAEGGEIGGSHGSSLRGLRPTARSTSALGGSKGTWRVGLASLASRRGGRPRRAFFTGSTRWSARRWPSCSTHGGVARSTRQRATVTTRPAR